MIDDETEWYITIENWLWSPAKQELLVYHELVGNTLSFRDAWCAAKALEENPPVVLVHPCLVATNKRGAVCSGYQRSFGWVSPVPATPARILLREMRPGFRCFDLEGRPR